MGQIYKITIQKPSGEIFNYIGKSSLTSEIRFKSHQSGDQLVDRYMKKYLDSTVLTTLVTGVQTEEELNDLESYYIQKFESYKPWGKNGLNLTLGGEGVRKYNISKDELQGYINEGLSDSEICVRLGNVSGTVLKNSLKSFGIERKSLFEIHESTIRQMITDGKTQGEISTATGIGSDKLPRLLKEAGLKAAKKPRVTTTPEMIEQVRILTAEGRSCYEIERATRIHFVTVNSIQRKLGIKSTATKVKNGATTVTSELTSKVIELRKTGLSQYAISRELGCARCTVGFILQGKYDHLK